MAQALRDTLSEELNRPVAETVKAIAAVLRERYARAAVAVLFYGSCLRSPEAELADNLLDFYVLVDDYGKTYDKTWLAVANRILPAQRLLLRDRVAGDSYPREVRRNLAGGFRARFCRPETQNVSVLGALCPAGTDRLDPRCRDR